MKTDRLFQALYALPAFPERLKEHTNSGAAFRKHVDNLIQHETYPNLQAVLKAGQRQNTMYFLDKGDARGYKYHQETGEEETVWLWKELSFLVSPQGFYLQGISDIYIEVLSGSELLSASYADMKDTFVKFPEGEILVRSVITQYYEFQKQRVSDSKTHSALTRYNMLLEEYPGVEQKFSQAVIASYLGITPEHLSRLKHR